MTRKKAKIRIPRELRSKVHPWKNTRQKMILEVVERVQDVQLVAGLLDIGKTTVYAVLKAAENKTR
jgi:transcriptional regulator with PAS, ATPase and Fis domain